MLRKAQALIRGRTIALIFLALLLALVSLPVPQVGPPLSEDVDSSLSAVLHYAHQHHLQYGRDIVFTYGPLGFLTFFYYFPDAFLGQVCSQFLLSLTVATGLCLVARRLFWPWRVLLLATFLWAVPNTFPRTDLLINTALFCWGILCFVESEKRLVLSVTILSLLVPFAAGTKVSFLFIGAVLVVLLVADLFTRSEKLLSFALLGGSAGAFLLEWIAAGQNVRHLPAFLANSLSVIRNYNAGMSLEGAEIIRGRGFVWAAASVVLVVLHGLTAFNRETAHRKIRRAFVGLWTLFFLFAIWKYGFIRVDRFHVMMALGFATLAPFILQSLPADPGVGRRLVVVAMLVCWLLPVATLQDLFFPSLWMSLKQPAVLFVDHVSALIQPRRYQAQLDEKFEPIRRAAQLPRCRELIGNSTVDVFGQDAGYAILNDLNYHPRPVFQSYFVSDASLAHLNEIFYASASRPEFVLFRLTPMESKLPALEDPRVLVQLFSNYEMVAVEKPYLLLRAKTAEPVRLEAIAKGTVQPGKPIDLVPYRHTNVWLEISLQPSLIGRLRQWFYRSPTVRLAAWYEPDLKRITRNRSPPPMLAAGFLAGPLLLKEDDILDLYNGSALLHPGAYTIELPKGEEYLWQSEASWRLFRVENPIGSSDK